MTCNSGHARFTCTFLVAILGWTALSGKNGAAHDGTVTFESIDNAGAQPDVVLEWSRVTVPCSGGVCTTKVHIAMHDALNSVDPVYAPLLADVAAPPGASAEAAMIEAAYRVNVQLNLALAHVFAAKRTETLAGIPDGQAKADGIEVGAQVASGVLAARASDGYAQHLTGQCGSLLPPEPGVYIPPEDNPNQFLLNSCSAQYVPYAMNSVAQFRPDGAPALTSEEYAKDFNEVQSLGALNSSTGSDDQTHASLFWRAGAYTAWNRVLQNIYEKNYLSLHDGARLFAAMNVAITDTNVACNATKYFYNFWRPVSAIRQADSDGNPLTVQDPGWTPLNPTPNIPDYPSSAACLAASASEVIERVLGDLADTSFCMTLPTAVPPNSQRCFSSVEEAVTELGNSRVWIGFHFRTAVRDGEKLGRRIGKWVNNRTMLRLK